MQEPQSEDLKKELLQYLANRDCLMLQLGLELLSSYQEKPAPRPQHDARVSPMHGGF